VSRALCRCALRYFTQPTDRYRLVCTPRRWSCLTLLLQTRLKAPRFFKRIQHRTRSRSNCLHVLSTMRPRLSWKAKRSILQSTARVRHNWYQRLVYGSSQCSMGKLNWKQLSSVAAHTAEELRGGGILPQAMPLGTIGPCLRRHVMQGSRFQLGF
jgi:hypothetical protein